MIEYPGVYVEEGPGPRPIEGVPTSTAAFLGPTRKGPKRARPICSYIQFARVFGQSGPFARAVRAFFDNGGRQLVVARVTRGDYVAALAALADCHVAVVAAPGAGEAAQRTLVAHCEAVRTRFAVLDAPKGADWRSLDPRATLADTPYAAYYFPWIETAAGAVPPSGAVCGVYARTDVWKAPAGEEISGATGLAVELNDAAQAVLNPRGVNAIRKFPGRGILVWGARTLSSDPQWKYVNVRRLLLFLEDSIDRGTRWAVFEPNGEPLWARLRALVEQFLLILWRAGAFMGQTPKEAFFVRCDRGTMTQKDIDNGILIVEIGVAPLKRAEFIVLRFRHELSQ